MIFSVSNFMRIHSWHLLNAWHFSKVFKTRFRITFNNCFKKLKNTLGFYFSKLYGISVLDINLTRLKPKISKKVDIPRSTTNGIFWEFVQIILDVYEYTYCAKFLTRTPCIGVSKISKSNYKFSLLIVQIQGCTLPWNKYT